MDFDALKVGNKYCEVDMYGEHELFLKVNFDSGQISVDFDKKRCLVTELSRNLFIKNKATITLLGSNDFENPVEFALDEFTIEK